MSFRHNGALASRCATNGLKPGASAVLYAMRKLRIDPNSAFKKERPCGRRRDRASITSTGPVRSMTPHVGAFSHQRGPEVAAPHIRYRGAVAISATSTAITGRHALHRGAAHRGREALFSRHRTRTPSTYGPTTTGSTEETVVLPGGFPNLLAKRRRGRHSEWAWRAPIPTHNEGELCDAAGLHQDQDHPKPASNPGRHGEGAGTSRPAAVCRSSATSMIEATKRAPRRLRLRARYPGRRSCSEASTDHRSRGSPIRVQKGKLIERIAEISKRKKLPISRGKCADESADECGIC